MQATLLVLAGGHSRRMGRPKAWLEVGDTVLLRHVVDNLAPAFAEVIVAFAEPGLLAAHTDVTSAAACNMPYVTQEVAHMAIAAARRCDAALPRIDGRPEPLCGAYRRSALPFITGALHHGRLKAADIANDLDVTWLEGLDASLFRSLNTTEDFEQFMSNLRRSDNGQAL